MTVSFFRNACSHYAPPFTEESRVPDPPRIRSVRFPPCFFFFFFFGQVELLQSWIMGARIRTARRAREVLWSGIFLLFFRSHGCTVEARRYVLHCQLVCYSSVRKSCFKELADFLLACRTLSEFRNSSACRFFLCRRWTLSTDEILSILSNFFTS